MKACSFVWMKNQKLSALHLIGSLLFISDKTPIGIVRDVVFSATTKGFFFIINVIETLDEEEIYFAIPPDFLEFEPNLEGLKFQVKGNYSQAFSKKMLPDFYEDVPIRGINSFLKVYYKIHQQNSAAGHRTDQDIG